MSRELVVTGDVAGAAVERFLAWRPRTIALAGGNTPRGFYERLARTAYDWPATHLFFGDERCVQPGDADSNYRLAEEALLRHVPAQVHPMPGETCDAATYEAALRAHFGPGRPRFDLIVLGLGADGHTASLFPGDAALQETSASVVRVDRPDHPRLTLTLPVLNAAARVLFLVTGAEKAAALTRLMNGDVAIPAARVQQPLVTVITDRESAVITAARGRASRP